MSISTSSAVRGPVLTKAALADGLTKEQLRGEEWRQIYWGVHVLADVDLDVAVRARAGLLLHGVPDAHLSHTTVAQLLGIPTPSDDEIHVTVHDRRDRRYRPGLRPHYRVRASDCARVRGMPVSASLQLFVELSSILGLVDTVIAGDHMVRHGYFGIDELVAYCADLRGKHTRKSRRAARLVRSGVDSPMETRLRLLIVLAGLPEPVVNHLVRDGSNHVRRRFDLCYPFLRLVIEYDGRHHIERTDQWEADLERREELDDGGWRIVVVVARGIFQDPEHTLRRVHHALVARGGRPGRLRDDWRAHFPPR